METGNYICHLCEKEYEPTKRGIQKFCSSKCRKKYNYHKNIVPSDKSVATETISKPSKIKVEEMSLAGVGNAATGALLADGLKGIVKAFQPEENKLATKKDIQELKNFKYKRYFLIQNMERRYDGFLPYFDMTTNSLIYLRDPNYINPAANIL
ncbi:hypothetical protein [Lutibacter sp.]|uniref:hypothetical protein n=1 Tax=Lutibacter sp. TaxID=1925666 RepID=UPI00349FFEA2